MELKDNWDHNRTFGSNNTVLTPALHSLNSDVEHHTKQRTKRRSTKSSKLIKSGQLEWKSQRLASFCDKDQREWLIINSHTFSKNLKVCRVLIADASENSLSLP